VLLPISAVTHMPPAQLEALLAHELAHIRRHDYLANLLQTAVETLLFYHPAVWWVSDRIRAERENCCDDAALRVVKDPITYARALATLEEMRSPRLALAPAGNGGDLMDRIRRITGVATGHRYTPSAWMAGALLAAIILGILAGPRLAATRSTGAGRAASCGRHCPAR
jgi:beta-lactamase regulating signal transducer with metallopeptidase domain